MSESGIPIYFDPMEGMIAQIRQEERNNVRTDIALNMIIGKETDERIARYTKLDIEAVREIRAVWEDLVKGESKRKTRAMNYSLRIQAPLPLEVILL